MPHWFVYYDHLDCSCVISLGVSETNFYLVAAPLLARDTLGKIENLIVSIDKYGRACPLKLVCPLPYLAIPNTFISGSAPLNFKFIPALTDLSELKMFPIGIWILMRKWKHLCKSVHFVSQYVIFFLMPLGHVRINLFFSFQNKCWKVNATFLLLFFIIHFLYTNTILKT